MGKLSALRTILLAAMIFSLLAGCRAPDIQPPATPIPPTHAPATLVPAPVEEVYEEINTADFRMDIQTKINGRVETDANGNVTQFGGGEIVILSVGGSPVALRGVDLLYENQKVYVDTWDFGKILLSFNPDFSMGVWMKPSQMAKIRTFMALALAATPASTVTEEVFIPWTETPTAVPLPPTSTPILATPTHDASLGSLTGTVEFTNTRVSADQVEVILVDAKDIDPVNSPIPFGFQILNSISVQEPHVAQIEPGGQFKMDNIAPGKYVLALRGRVLKTEGFAFCKNDAGPDGWDLVWLAEIGSDGQLILSGDVLAVAFNGKSSSMKVTMSGANTLTANIQLKCQ